MIVAELEVWHSRPIAPTRRVALGKATLPVDPPPGYGGILLGGIVGSHISAIDPDLVPDLLRLMTQVEEGQRVPQPRLRHRLQVDQVGLQRSRLRLVAEGDDLAFAFDHAHAAPAQLVLGATYAVGRLAPPSRRAVMATLRRAVTWEGAAGPELIAALAGWSRGRDLSRSAFENPVGWALDVLGFSGDGSRDGRRRAGPGLGSARPDRSAVTRRFRELLREAHPDHGAESEGAAQRIADLTEARRILLAGGR
ncbi:MAG: hypothetical protein R2726_04210 [Acidimicrobiales bacterium]